MSTPLTDSINALTTYANEVTGVSDTNLSDAVHTLASGYGGGVNMFAYVSNCSSLFMDASLPETVELDFAGNTGVTNLSSMFFRTSGVKHLIIKNLVSAKKDIPMNAFLYISPDVVDVTFENCSFAPNSLESFGRTCNNLENVFGEIDCTNCTGANTLKFWFTSPKLKNYRIKPNTIKYGMKDADFGASKILTDETLASIGNGLDSAITGQTLYLRDYNKEKIGTIIGNNENGTFILDPNGTMSLADFITNVKGWTLA